MVVTKPKWRVIPKMTKATFVEDKVKHSIVIFVSLKKGTALALFLADKWGELMSAKSKIQPGTGLWLSANTLVGPLIANSSTVAAKQRKHCSLVHLCTHIGAHYRAHCNFCGENPIILIGCKGIEVMRAWFGRPRVRGRSGLCCAVSPPPFITHFPIENKLSVAVQASHFFRFTVLHRSVCEEFNHWQPDRFLVRKRKSTQNTPIHLPPVS